MLQKKIHIFLFIALMSGCASMTEQAWAQAPAPAPATAAAPVPAPTTAPAATVATPPVAPATASVAATVPVPKAEDLALELEALKGKIKRCAELQDRSIRMTCYDNNAADLGYITVDRAKNEAQEIKKIGFWQMSEKTGADGVKTTYMRLESSNMLESPNGTERQVSLVLRCSPGKTDAFLDWKTPVVSGLRAEKEEHVVLTYYTNNGEKVTTDWEISTDKFALFSLDSVQFIKDIMKGTKLTMEFVPHNSAIQSAYFDTTGINVAVDTIVKRCY